MHTSPLFRELDLDTRREVVSLFELRKAPSGLLLFEAGAAGDGLYIPLTGGLRVLPADSEERWLGPGSVVGISSLLTETPIAHSVETFGDTLLLRLPAARFMGLIMQYPTVLEELTYLSVSDALG
jgi:CRP-like cAMP-binding protein